MDPNTHTIRLQFNNTSEDQALYNALRASSEREHRTPLPRQLKFLLAMAMGLRDPDLFLLKRLGFSDVDEYDVVPGIAAAVAREIASPTRPPATLCLIPSGTEHADIHAGPKVS